MTPRERTLAMLVGGTLGLLGVNYGFQKYLGSINTAEKKIDVLQSQIDDKENEILLGDRAARDFKRLSEQSLSSNPQVARAQYTDWLTKLVADCSLSNVSVDYTNQQGSKIYRVLSFSVKGSGSLAQITNLLDRFYGREILHRISKMTVTPDMQQPGRYSLSMVVDAVSFMNAPANRPLPGVDLAENAPRSEAALKLLRRNPLSLPNKAPRLASEPQPRTFVNQPFEYNLRFEDPERHNVSVELTGEPPAGLVFERGRVTWQPTEVGRYELLVRATDDGWPAESVDQKIVVEVSAEPPPAEPPKFDESRVAVLTGLVRTGDTWQAWINVRTRAQGNRMALAVGDKVKIGAVEGEVVEINDTQVVILSNNRRLVIRPGQSLAEAIPAS